MVQRDGLYAVLRVRRALRHFLPDCLFENRWGQS